MVEWSTPAAVVENVAVAVQLLFSFQKLVDCPFRLGLSRLRGGVKCAKMAPGLGVIVCL